MSTNKYYTHVQPRLAEIREWFENGAVIEEVAKRLGISFRSFLRYKDKYDELQQVYHEAKLRADYKVQNSLFKRAIGYTYVETKVVVDANGNQKVEKTEKHLPPDTSAAIFWLKNRMRDEWGEKIDTNISSLDQLADAIMKSASVFNTQDTQDTQDVHDGHDAHIDVENSGD